MNFFRELLARFYLEEGLIYHYFLQSNKAKVFDK